MEYRLYGDFLIIYPKPYSIYLRVIINLNPETVSDSNIQHHVNPEKIAGPACCSTSNRFKFATILGLRRRNPVKTEAENFQP